MALSCSVRLTDRGTDCLFTDVCTEDSQRGQTQCLAHKDSYAYYLVERFRFLKLRAPSLEHKPLAEAQGTRNADTLATATAVESKGPLCLTQETNVFCPVPMKLAV